MNCVGAIYDIRDSSVGEFLASCPKLKCLRLCYVKFRSPEVFDSLYQRTYPSLKYVTCLFNDNTAIEWMPFLERNPTIKGICVETEGIRYIPLNRAPPVQLEYLEIHFPATRHYAQQLNRLKTLYSNGWYKALRVLYDGNEASFIDELVPCSAPLEALFICVFHTNLCHFVGLKELQFFDFQKDINLDLIAKSLVNLERLLIGGAVERMVPFLRHSKNLKFIGFPDYWKHCESAGILHKLNEARKMSSSKSKVQIGVNEDSYMATKWMVKDMNFGSIEIVHMNDPKNHFLLNW